MGDILTLYNLEISFRYKFYDTQSERNIEVTHEKIISNGLFEDFNISNPKMFLTSPITFFKTNLEIINSSFKNFIGEDMINIVNTEFKIDDSKFI